MNKVNVDNHTAKKRSQFRMVWFRFRKNKLAMLGLITILLLATIALICPLFLDYETDVIQQNMSERLLSPSAEHWFGTDQYGRDLFARIVWGTRTSLSIGLAAICLSLIGGSIFGSVAGYYGGWLESCIMRVADVFLAIPNTVLAIAIVAALGNSVVNLLIAMSISNIPIFARVVRAAILQIRGQEYIEAAHVCGTSDARIIFRHIIPNAIGPIIIQATLDMANAILTIAALGFVGLGIPSPSPEWGTILSENQSNMRYYPHLVIIPGIIIIITVMALNFIGDGLRDALDPRLKN